MKSKHKLYVANPRCVKLDVSNPRTPAAYGNTAFPITQNAQNHSTIT